MVVLSLLGSATALAQDTGTGGDALEQEAIPPPPAATETPPAYDAPVPAPPAAQPPPDGGARYPSGEGARPEGFADADAEIRIPPRIATRLRVLESDFNALAARGGNSIVDGVLSILTGGLTITLAVLLADEPNIPEEYLYLYGGATVARGIIDLVLMPNPSDAAIAFAHMPMGSPREVMTRLRYGETELESLADRTRMTRIIDASLNIGVGVAVIPLWFGPRDYEIQPFDWFIIIGSAISVISGLINLLSRSEAERRWSAYEELRDRLRREQAQDRRRRRGSGSDGDTGPPDGQMPAAGTLQVGAAPLPDGHGGAAVLSGRF
jgi:hypothetical protein